MSNKKHQEMRLSNRLQVGILFAVIVIPLAIAAVFDPHSTWGSVVYSELGVVENGTILFAAFGLWYAARATSISFRSSSLLTAGYCFLIVLGFIYIITEESSWGQHWVAWETPDWLSDINRYGEANLHNISYEADRLPKTLVGLFIVLFGIGTPLLSRRNPQVLEALPSWFRTLLPARETFPLAIVFLTIWMANRSIAWLDLREFNGRGFASAEHLELIMVVFLFAYTLVLYRSFVPQSGYGETEG